MSEHCEGIRPLIAELVYGEVDPDVAESIREHLGSCLPCRRYRKAFEAVRGDLQQWQPAAETPRGITFIAPAATRPAGVWSSRTLRGLAIAASFVIGVFLMAAVTNVQIQSNADGWTLSTSLWDAPTATSPQPAELLPASSPEPSAAALRAQTVSLEDINQQELNAWLDARFEEQVAARGLTPVAAPAPPLNLTDAQSQHVATLIQDYLEARDTQHEQFIRGLIADSENRTYEQLVFTLASVYDNMEAEHDDELFEIANQLGVWQVDTERRLQQANTRIDNLVTTVASREREPEN